MHKKIITGVVIAVLLFSLAVAMAFMGNGERTAQKTAAGEKIAIVHIEGTIMSSSPGGFGNPAVAAADQITRQLKEARENPDIKAVILKMNTGGGTVVGSDEIGREVERVRQSGKKVVVAMGEMAASGGYWISCKADKIVANPGTFTGSIGVIMQLTEMKDLFNKLGIEVKNIKTGAYKDMGSSNKELSPEEQEIFQSLVNDSYEDFVKVVAEGRKMDPVQVRKLADGRIYTGKQAKQLGLVDALGDFDTAVQITAELAGIKGEPELIDMTGEQLLWQQILGGLQGNTQLMPIPLEGLLLLPDKVAAPMNTNVE
ncbi:signal peptide peptidase SppA [Desulfotomaculum sp. 1211_IL3151]|uniref:signal peptide peptidase SppA n=1 Tax=Desulfotomaculum sp. 1211_IL3151 TaxID=3084055 RepID=UPI002FD96BBD